MHWTVGRTIKHNIFRLLTVGAAYASLVPVKDCPRRYNDSLIARASACDTLFHSLHVQTQSTAISTCTAASCQAAATRMVADVFRGSSCREATMFVCIWLPAGCEVLCGWIRLAASQPRAVATVSVRALMRSLADARHVCIDLGLSRCGTLPSRLEQPSLSTHVG